MREKTNFPFRAILTTLKLQQLALFYAILTPTKTKGSEDMKKKILIGAFLLLILLTAIGFIVAAVDSYNYDMDPANGIDVLEGVGAAMLITVGGFVVLCEIDLFFTVYYFLIKPKALSKSIFMLLSQLMILPVIFGNNLAKFLSLYVSDIFKEEIIVIAPIFIIYVISRSICIPICFSKKDQ